MELQPVSIVNTGRNPINQPESAAGRVNAVWTAPFGSDGDGLSDIDEAQPGTNPNNVDSRWPYRMRDGNDRICGILCYYGILSILRHFQYSKSSGSVAEPKGIIGFIDCVH